MNSKERVMRAIAHKETDRVPFGLFGTGPADEDRIRQGLGCRTIEDMYRELGIDIWYTSVAQYTGRQRMYKGEAADYWGIPVSAGKEGDSSNRCPLADVSSIEEVERYEWPSADDFDYNGLVRNIDSHSEFAIMGGVWAPIFHNMTWLCGLENTLTYFILQPEVSGAILRHITDFWVDYTRKTLEAAKGKIDIIENCNDFGTQNGLLMSPELFRKLIKPALKRLFDVIKEYDVKIMQHSCGSIYTLIPDFIEIGVDIINPVQVSAANMDIELMAKEFGGKITFYGGIDTQHVLPEGPVERIREETRRAIRILGKNGGFILAGSQGIQSDISFEHLLAMFDEGKKFKQSFVV